MITDYLFYILGVLSVLFAVASVCTHQILRAATYLMGVLCLSSGFYILLGAELLAGVQILVYVGGIVVLLVIAVMLTQSNRLGADQVSPSRKLSALITSVSFFAGSTYLLLNSSFASRSDLAIYSGSADSIKSIGLAFLDSGPNGFLLPFEIISLLLLVVLVAGIVIARKETP